MTDTNSMIYETNWLSTVCAGLIDSQVINKAEHKKTPINSIVSCLQDNTHTALPVK